MEYWQTRVLLYGSRLLSARGHVHTSATDQSHCAAWRCIESYRIAFRSSLGVDGTESMALVIFYYCYVVCRSVLGVVAF
jgi:hypothetical protein